MVDENDLWDCDKKINNKIVLVSDETFELGKKQGALEELKKLSKFIDGWYSAIDGERLTEYYANRIKELERCEKTINSDIIKILEMELILSEAKCDLVGSEFDDGYNHGINLVLMILKSETRHKNQLLLQEDKFELKRLVGCE